MHRIYGITFGKKIGAPMLFPILSILLILSEERLPGQVKIPAVLVNYRFSAFNPQLPARFSPPSVSTPDSVSTARTPRGVQQRRSDAG